MQRADVTTAARAWVGTPLRANACEIGIGVDSFGLVRGVGAMAGSLSPPDTQWLGGLGAPPEHLARTFLAYVLRSIPADQAGEGDVCLLRDPASPQLAVVGIRTALNGLPYLVRLVHGAGRIKHTGQALSRVVEHGFLPPWPAAVAPDGWYRFPGLEP